MKQYYQGRLAAYSLWIDIILLNLGFGLSTYVMLGYPPADDIYLILQMALNLLWLGLTYFLQTYPLSRLDLSVQEFLGRFFKVIVLLVLIVAALLFFSKYGARVSRLVLFWTIANLVLSGSLVRMLMVQALRSFRQAGHNRSGYIMVGNCDMSQELRNRYEARKDLGMEYRGTFEFSEKAFEEEFAQLEDRLEATKADYLYCCMKSLTPVQIQGIIGLGERQRVQVRLVPDFRGFLPCQAKMVEHDVVPVIEVSTKPYVNEQDEMAKRTFDLAFSAVVMVLGAPVFGVVALLVKLLSPGPVFFKQERTGRWGQLFYIYKFRTMYTDADKMGLQHSQGNYDPRVTPIGRILRKTRLDELPQFINVMRGEMSVVGPRPLFRYDVDMLMRADPTQFKRLLTVKPGVTSIGQLTVGYADSLTLNLARMRHDLGYLRKYSIRYDLQLILKTMQVMVEGRGK
ncbi:sugar transferase [Persicitalea jodogahamensis]|uniref:Undecaprenyl-phosphate glucose phosphotransferase n=1 Tax=Persicitalea jodogahamensis TaxID=402147 RepID=A0A8J3G9F2_9BACT|nr:sugar transferase [Persicitalea jodogahamensis]GHB63013.1 undecaprenyl-phosphate glucose phosphotransferase [Persicitalea jodogahamensis]